MTSKLTREQLHERARENVKALKMASRQTAFESAREEILADLQLAELALAAMDSEPVAWTWQHLKQWYVTNDEERARELAWDGVKVEPLYRHAQQPVVPDDVLEALQKVARIRLDLNDFDGDCRGIADCLGDAEEALIEVVSRRAAMLHAGNSPAQSDCCPAQNSVAPAQSPIDHGYRPECECSGCKATARICADLSANSPANPGCWCRICRPVVLNDMRFVVCPDCGNKRCPRANDHRNTCTGSNEPGQEGSAYPSAPQEVKP
ncbi:hypothetical protein ACYA02_01170 [Klebsiella pneumoniae]